MTTTQQWLEAYTSGGLVMALVFEGVDYVATTATEEECSTIQALFEVGAPYDDWTVFKPGLMVAGTSSQEIQLYSPDVSADNLTFTIVDDVNDTLAGQILREGNSTGNRTYLTTSVAAGSTSALTVKDTTGFASSGTVYIGHEAISYTTTTATTFGGTVGRALWTMQQTNGGSNFAPSHPISDNITVNATTAPAVTDYPRTWYGRFVNLMVFYRDEWGNLCSPTDATVIWRGRIQSYRDNGDGSISLDCKSCLDLLQRPIGQDSWTADMGSIMYVGATGFGSFNSRLAVQFCSSGGTIYSPGARLTAGYYTHQELAAVINAQFESWRSGASYGSGDSFSLNLVDGFSDGSPSRYMFTFRNNTTTITQSDVVVFMHPNVANMLGFTYDAPPTKWSGDSVLALKLHAINSTKTHWQLVAKEPPVAYFAMDVFQGATMRVDNAFGTFLTNSPLGYGAAAGANGCVQLSTSDAENIYAVKYEAASGSNPDRITALGKLNLQTGEFEALPKYKPPEGTSTGSTKPVRLGEVNGPPRIRQVFYERGPAGTVLLRALLSTAGSSNYNHATYDQWMPAGRGAAVPASLVDIASWEDLDEVDTMLLITEPKPFVEYLEPVLAATNRYVVWRASSSSTNPKIAIVRPELDQTFQQTWSLTESNKAGALGGPDRTIVERVPDGLINVIKFQYGMGLDKNAPGSVIEINDVASQGDYGRKRSVTVKCPGLPRASVEKMAGTVAQPIISYLSRPLCIAERTFNASLLRMAPGDAVSLTDNYVMGPRTGTRGADTIYGWVIGTSFDWATGVGKVRIVFLPEKDPSRTGSWSPSARVDDGAAGSGYNAGTKTLTLVQNYYSPSGATADAARFASGDKVHVYSLDESAPLEWFDEISGTPTNTTMVLTTGLAGFDTSKKYVVEADDISTVQNSQRGGTFLADASTLSTGYVSNPVPYEWGTSNARVWDTAAISYSRAASRPNTSYDDQGEPLSVHKLVNVADGINQMIGYKHAQVLLNEYTYYGVASGTTENIMYVTWVPLYSGFTISVLTAKFRSISVLVRGNVTGGTGTFRVYTSPTPPVGSVTSFTIPGTSSDSMCTLTTSSATNAWTSLGSISAPAVAALQNGMYGTFITVTAQNDTPTKLTTLTNFFAAMTGL